MGCISTTYLYGMDVFTAFNNPVHVGSLKAVACFNALLSLNVNFKKKYISINKH